MGAVDVCDKYIYHYSCSRTTPKYWKKLFCNFIYVAIFNAFILYSHNTDKPKTWYEFLVEIVEDLADHFNGKKLGFYIVTLIFLCLIVQCLQC